MFFSSSLREVSFSIYRCISKWYEYQITMITNRKMYIMSIITAHILYDKTFDK